jgi:hypothetical protein
MIATIFDPPSGLREIVAGLPHHRLVIAFQGNQGQRIGSPIHQAFDDTTAVRTSVNVIAERNNRRALTRRMLGNPRERCLQQVKAAMDIRYGVGETHSQSTVCPDLTSLQLAWSRSLRILSV